MDKVINKVLLIDNDEVANFLSRSALELSGYSQDITTKLNAEDALAYLKDQIEKNTPPDLILLDLSMPKMDGWEFIREYNKLDSFHKAKIAIVVLTASTNPDHQKQAESYDVVNAFRTKPITVDMVKEIHDKVLYLFH